MKKGKRILLLIVGLSAAIFAGTVVTLAVFRPPAAQILGNFVLGILLLTGGFPLLYLGASLEQGWFKKYGEKGGPLNLLFEPFEFFWSILPLIFSTIGSLASLGGLALLVYAAYTFVRG